MQEYKTGNELLAAWNPTSREHKLELAVKALLNELENLHLEHLDQSLKENIDNPEIYCSCSDAYRMGVEALK